MFAYNENTISDQIHTKWAGKTVHFAKETDSTNLWIKRLAKEGAPQGTLALAEFQSAGRGRLGRSWEVPEGTSVMMSILLRPEFEPQYAPMLTLVMGMAHVPEGRRVFADMSVYENLLLGAYTRKDKAEIAESLAGVYKRFPRLEERKGQRAGTLSGGEQQMLAMGRALMSRPRIILMDEPSMGLSPIFVNEIFDIIREVSESGTTVLLVEQNAKKALSIADRAYVLETGSITMDGKAEDLLNDEAVQKAYLGE